jgi:hypothetical protein
MQQRALRLMASKLAVATLIEGNFSDEGLAALSECQDLMAELAKELTQGISEEVDDLAETFKKMAIVSDGAAKTLDVSQYAILPEEDEIAEAEKAVEIGAASRVRPDVSEKIRAALLAAEKASAEKRRKKPIKFDPNQTDLFDLLAS